MRSASLFAVAVLALLATALPIQSAFAALTLDIKPNPVLLGDLITFTGTGANPGDFISLGIWQASDQCAGSPQTGATGNADNSGNYQITFSSSLSVGQYGAQTVANVPPLYPKSPCVAFTVTASGFIQINKVTTNGDTTTIFSFVVSSGGESDSFQLVGGGQPKLLYPGVESPPITITEVVPDGWYISRISCEGMPKVNEEPSIIEVIPGNGAIITFVSPDMVTCTFTNSPITPAVGGVVIPSNNFTIVAPWLGIIGLVGCVTAVAVVARKRGILLIS